MRGRWIGVLLIGAAALLAGERAVTVPVRTRVQPFKNSEEWREVRLTEEFQPDKTAIVICDMWDRHWCGGAQKRVGEIAPRMDAVLAKARARGITIIHAPSETMDFYKDDPRRQKMAQIALVQPPAALAIADPPLPIDTSKSECDTHDKPFKAWTRETPLLHMADSDLISDKGPEIYSYVKQKGISTVLIMGVHANMCILNRSFAIKQMSKWGVRCLLVRDLTDAEYDPEQRPYVSHEKGTQLVIEHIEKYWVPTLLSTDLVRALGEVQVSAR